MLSRTREIGLRMALGAGPRAAGMLIVAQGLKFVVAGLVAGIALCIPAGMIASNAFMGAEARDPFPIASAIIALAIACTAAGFVPALRAARVQPMVALRQD